MGGAMVTSACRHGTHTAIVLTPHLVVLFVMQAGDRVVYSKYAGTDVQVAGEEHVLLKVGPATASCFSLQHLSPVASQHVKPVQPPALIQLLP